LMRLAEEVGASVATLEVRLSNQAARQLYIRFGFRPVGLRPHYYTDNGEDALIMTTGELWSSEMQSRLDALSRRYERVGAGDLASQHPPAARTGPSESRQERPA